MCENYWAKRIFCKFVQAWSQQSTQKRNGEAQTVVCSIKHNLTLNGAGKEDEIQFSLSTSAFRFLDDIFTRNQKLRKQGKSNEMNTS